MTTQKKSTKPSTPNGRPSVTDLVKKALSEQPKRRIGIDDEFKSLIAPPTDHERTQLEENLKREGCRDPLVIWVEANILVDGHTRYEICERTNIAYGIKEISFRSREKAIDWICMNQLGRRNLNPVDASLLRGKMYNGRKKTKAEAGAKGGASKVQKDTCSESTAEDVAKQTGVSAATIKRNGKLAEALDKVAAVAPGVMEKVRSGEVKKSAVVAAAKVVETNPTKAAEILEAGRSGDLSVPDKASNAAPPVDSLAALVIRAKASSHFRRLEAIKELLETLPEREIGAVQAKCESLISARLR